MENPEVHWVADPPKETLGKKVKNESLRIGAITALVTGILAAYTEYQSPDETEPVTTTQQTTTSLPERDNGGLVDLIKRIADAQEERNRQTQEYADLVKQQWEQTQAFNKQMMEASPCSPDNTSPFIPVPQGVNEAPPLAPPAEPEESVTLPLPEIRNWKEQASLVPALRKQIDDMADQIAALQPKPFTGLYMDVPNPKGLLEGTDKTCPPCTTVIHGIFNYGHNWSIGLTDRYSIKVRQISNADRNLYGYPLIHVVENGQIKETFDLRKVNYSSSGWSITNLLRKHPKWGTSQ